MTDDAFLRGETCDLRPLRPADADGPWARWFNDPEVNRWLFRGVFPTTPETQRSFLASIDPEQAGDLVLAIVDRPEDRHVGTIGLHRIDWVNRTAELGIVVGEPDARGRGIGTEATRLIVAHGFRRLNLHRIWLGVMAEHEAAVRLYEKVGFQVEGRLREEMERDGRRHDKLIMGLLARELPHG
ncbi:MAG TPA: GNAT family protein [Capillimicrobium sp.]|jgi:RimJ/RimL family protein N-acetyltransferase